MGWFWELPACNAAAPVPKSPLFNVSSKLSPQCPHIRSPHVLTVLRLIFVGRAELLDDLLLLGLHHGRVALRQLAEERWRLRVVSWGLGPHPAKQKAISNLCKARVTKSHLVRPLPLGQLVLISLGLLRYLGFPTFLPVPNMNVLHRAAAPLQVCKDLGCDSAFGCKRKSSA